MMIRSRSSAKKVISAMWMLRAIGVLLVLSGICHAQTFSARSIQTFSTANGQATEHVFDLPSNAAPTGDATIQVGMRGDYGSSSEYATVSVNGDYMGTFDPGTECSADYAVKTFTVSQTDLDQYFSSGQMTVKIQNSSDVNFCDIRNHQVTVQFEYTGSVTPTVTVPEAPQNLSYTLTGNEVTLSWKEPASDGGGVITEYKIFRGPSTSQLSLLTTVDGYITTCTDTSAGPGMTYHYAVCGVNTAGDGATAQVSVTTPNLVCTFSLSETSGTFSSGSGSDTVTLTASNYACDWTADSSSSWISVSPASGSGGRTVTITVDANNDTDDRTGTVIIAGETYTVTQTGKPCGFGISPGSQNMDDSGGTVTVTITASDASCDWTVSESLSWVTVSPTSGTGSGIVTLMVDNNSDTQERTGIITIAGKSFDLTQAPISQTWYRDADNDGYGDPNITQSAPSQPSGYVLDDTDCDDSDDTIHPGATETCGDGTDQDCSGSDETCVVKEISIISPSDNEIASFGGSSGNVPFLFTKIGGAEKYVLYIKLYDILNYQEIPIPLDLIPPNTGGGSWSSGTAATPGFTETVLGMSFTLQLDTTLWDVMAQYDIQWGVEAYNSADIRIGSTYKNGSEVQYRNHLKLIASNAIVLQSPSPGTTLPQSGSAPVFQWELYPGSSSYTLLLAHVGSVGFDTVVQKDNLTLNLLTMDDPTWQAMPDGDWYWTVLGYNAGGTMTPSDFTIFDFTVGTGGGTTPTPTPVTCTYSLSSSSGDFDTYGESKGVSISASDYSCSWSVSESLSWVSVYPSSGYGDGDVTITVDANTGSSSRSGSVTIAGKTYTITQGGPAPTPSPGPTGPSYSNSLGMSFVSIPAGTFLMGSPSDEPGRWSDETQHQVTISQSYYMQTTEVTQGQWESVMGSNPSYFSSCGSDCPVERVSWNDVQDFIAKLNQRGEGAYALPTEAQWEYAARAGTTSAFAFGDCLGTDQANYYGDYPLSGCPSGIDRNESIAVGSFSPNAWGLYDMHGNVWEWCQDWYDDYPTGSVTDPTGPSSGASRVFRGGSWNAIAWDCRSAYRGISTPGLSFNIIGFRVVLLSPAHPFSGCRAADPWTVSRPLSVFFMARAKSGKPAGPTAWVTPRRRHLSRLPLKRHEAHDKAYSMPSIGQLMC